MLPAEASGTSMAASGYRVALALAVPLSLRGPARRARARGGMRRGAPARRRARLRPYAAAMAIDLTAPPANFLAFWREKHVCTLTTPRPDGTPHVVPVGVTYDPGERLARIITGGATTKVRHVRAAGDGGARVAVCQPAGRYWSTLEGVATVSEDPVRVADAERRYALRYGREPRENPARVVIEIAVTRAMGNLPRPA
ncbi:Pyridoxamine 5'-phosphate oxidase [Streptomyces sp. ADI98-12]|nr:Pyridoxamine 5'-phosphate oxidase [Streptomyces sp. ADI98-12]